MAGCFGIGRTPRRVAEVYHITPKLEGFSDFPVVKDRMISGNVVDIIKEAATLIEANIR